jgi:hypothetical protein
VTRNDTNGQDGTGASHDLVTLPDQEFAAHRISRLLALLPDLPLTEDQVVLTRDDNVVGKGVASLDDLGIMPRNLETLLPLCFSQEPGTEDDS